MTKTKNIPARLRKKGIAQKLEQICQSNDVSFMAIFGSYVRGEQKQGSDLDIVIEYEKDARKTLFDLIDLEEELSKIFRKKVDLGIFHNLDPHIISRVQKEMKVIYEKR